MLKRQLFGILSLPLLLSAACAKFDHIGKPPDLTVVQQSEEYNAMLSSGLPRESEKSASNDAASLWSRSQSSLLGDRRAKGQGDILTVVIEIDESAEISNSTERSRTSNERLSVPELVGIPQRIDGDLPEGASLEDAVSLDSSGSSSGDGSIKRNEKLTLRIAATVTSVLPNGALQISGKQEVRVNFELRELLISGFVRPQDISRQNEITYDKIASARVSYGGRGHISDVQQPRIGQQILDAVLPF